MQRETHLACYPGFVAAGPRRNSAQPVAQRAVQLTAQRAVRLAILYCEFNSLMVVLYRYYRKNDPKGSAEVSITNITVVLWCCKCSSVGIFIFYRNSKPQRVPIHFQHCRDQKWLFWNCSTLCFHVIIFHHEVDTKLQWTQW
jgi:hypothetical protein